MTILTELLEARDRWGRDLTWAAATAFAFLAPLLAVGVVNIEQYQSSHHTVRIFHSNLLEHGFYAFWTGQVGLGTPLPLGENLALHPLFLLETVLPLRWVLRLFWLIHLTVGGFFVLRLCRMIDVDRVVARCVLLTWVASVATINYAYTDDWPSVFLGWTTLPLVLFLVGLVVREAWDGRARVAALWLVLVLAFMLCNSHLGYWATLVIPLGLFSMIAAGWSWRLTARLAAIALAAIVLAGERLLFVLQEMRLAPASLDLVTQPPLRVSEWIRGAFASYDPGIWAALVTGDLETTRHFFLELESMTRQPFLSFVLVASAATAVVRTVRRPATRSGQRLRRAVGICFVVSLVLSLLPPQWSFGLPSGMWLYRDPAMMFGMLAGAISLSRWRMNGTGAWRLAHVGLAIHVALVVLVALPPLLFVVALRSDNVGFYSGERAPELARWVASSTAGEPARTYLSPRLTYQLQREKAVFAELGLLGVGDLARFGLQPINGSFKNVSMDALYPSFKLLGGQIRSEAATIENAMLFDVLGVDYLLSLDNEPALDLSAFREIGEPLRTAVGGLRLYRNTDAWPRANLFAPTVVDLRLEQRPECPAAGLLCADVQRLARLRLESPVRISGDDRGFEATFAAAATHRVLVLSYMYRDAWSARADNGLRLRTVAVADALVGVAIPPGIERVRIAYTPRGRQLLAALGALGVVVVALLLIGEYRRREQR